MKQYGLLPLGGPFCQNLVLLSRIFGPEEFSEGEVVQKLGLSPRDQRSRPLRRERGHLRWVRPVCLQNTQRLGKEVFARIAKSRRPPSNRKLADAFANNLGIFDLGDVPKISRATFKDRQWLGMCGQRDRRSCLSCIMQVIDSLAHVVPRCMSSAGNRDGRSSYQPCPTHDAVE